MTALSEVDLLTLLLLLIGVDCLCDCSFLVVSFPAASLSSALPSDSDFLILPGFIDFTSDEVVSIPGCVWDIIVFGLCVMVALDPMLSLSEDYVLFPS